MTKQFKSLHDIDKSFRNEKACYDYLLKSRWPSEIGCPACGSVDPYHLKDKKTFKCRECDKFFNALTGTIFENTKLPLIKWFKAIYMVTSHKKGISSIQLGKDLGFTQKTGWFVLGRIRELVQEKAPIMLEGTVEVDESYFGGKDSNKHQSYRAKKARNTHTGRSLNSKTVVLGAVERKGKVVTRISPSVKSKPIQDFISTHIAKGSNMVSDDFNVYRTLSKKGYNHEYVNHSAREYVRGFAHTNTIEGYWSIMKRGVYGIYHQVSPKHLHRYCNEFAFRYNTRELAEAERFHYVIKRLDKTRLRYFELIDKRDTRRKVDIDPNFDGIWV